MRIRSEKSRQFLLVVGEGADPFTTMEAVELYADDGSPVVNVSDDALVMHWKGPWATGVKYNRNDVVIYDDGDGPGTYIFTEDISDALALEFDGEPVEEYLTESSFPVTMVLDATSPRSGWAGSGPLGDNLYPQTPYRAYAINLLEAGTISLNTAGVGAPFGRDTIARLWQQQPGGTYERVAVGDDEAGAGHPRITYAAVPGIYIFTFAIYLGDRPEAYGTSEMTKYVDNTAVYSEWDVFPLDKAVRLP